MLITILRGLCPQCSRGKIHSGLFTLHQRCRHCDYNFHPEPGFYLGAMMTSYFLGGISAIPTLLAVKMSNLDPMPWMMLLPCIQIVILMPLILHFSRIVWLHAEWRITKELDKQK